MTSDLAHSAARGAFFTLAFTAMAAGVLLTPACRERMRQWRHPAVRRMVNRLDDTPAVTATALPQLRPSVPLLLRAPAGLLADEGGRQLTQGLEHLLDEFQLGLGLPLPRIHLHAVSESDAAAGRDADPGVSRVHTAPEVHYYAWDGLSR